LVSFEEAALTEPASVALHALRRANIEIGDKVAILGTGPIGVILGQWARILGASQIFLVDVVEDKLGVAREYGFSEVINAIREDAVKSVLKKTGQGGVDISIEAAGTPLTFRQSVQIARGGGKVVFLGNMRGEVTLPEDLISSILRKELTMFGTWNSRFTHLPRNEWTTTLYFINKGKLEVKRLITHRFELKDVKEALQMMYKGKQFFNKVLLLP